MTAQLKMVTGNGVIETADVPSHGAGPDFREMLIGSEGIFGATTQATVRLQNVPIRSVCVRSG